MLVLNQMPSFNNTWPLLGCMPRRQGREAASVFDVDVTLPSRRTLVSICHREYYYTERTLLAADLSLHLSCKYVLLYGGIYNPNPALPTLCPDNF